MPSYRDIPYATTFGHISGHHYISHANTHDQFSVEVHWTDRTVHVRVLTDYDANAWHTVSITPLDPASSATDENTAYLTDPYL